MNELPETEDYEVNGRVIDVRKSAMGTALTAIIGISGQMNLSVGKSMLNAQIQFVFEPTRGRGTCIGFGSQRKAGRKHSRKGPR